MAGTSIAKLAVVITGDDGDLKKTLDHSSEAVKAFHGHTSNLMSEIKNSQGIMHLLEGRVGGLGHAMHILTGTGGMLAAGFGGLAIAGVAAIGMLKRFTEEATRAAIEEETLRAKNNATMNDIQRTLTTTAGQWKIFQDSTKPIGKTIGEVLAKDLRELLTVLNVATGGMQRFKEEAAAAGGAARKVGEERRKELEAKLEAQHGRLIKSEADELKKLQAVELERRDKIYQARFKEQMEEGMRGVQEVERRQQEMADRLKESLRTPAEIYRDSVQEAQQLLDAKVLSPEMMVRAVEQARAQLDAASKSRDAFHANTSVSVGAVERFTTAGFSAAQRGKTELDRIAQFEQQQAESLKRAEAQRDALLKAVERKEPINLAVANL